MAYLYIYINFFFHFRPVAIQSSLHQTLNLSIFEILPTQLIITCILFINLLL